MGSFLIIEHVKADPSIDGKFWRGGNIDKGFHSGIYRASNFRSRKNAEDLLKRMKLYNSPCELRKDRDYSIEEFQEAKKLTSNLVY